MIYINTWFLSWRKFILIRLSVHPGDFEVNFVCSFKYITCVNNFFVLSLDLRRKRMRSPENGVREEKISPSFITGKFSALSVYIKLLKSVFTCFQLLLSLTLLTSPKIYIFPLFLYLTTDSFSLMYI